jgi:hypothetical protein
MKRFGARLAQHLKDGTRPPDSKKTGFWGKEEFAELVERGSDRTVKNWCKGNNLPVDYEPLEFALFGKDATKDDDKYEAWRLELRRLFEEAKEEKVIKSDKKHLDKLRVRKAAADDVADVDETVDGAPTESVRTIVPPANQMPRVPRLFSGRDHLLGKIEESFRQTGVRVAATALFGLRGVGKTTLAAAYAESRALHYGVIWWFRAETENTLREDLAALAERLRQPNGKFSPQSTLGDIMEELGRLKSEVLLIFDNAIDTLSIKPYLPRAGNIHTLITSNSDDWREVAMPIELRPWPPEIGAEFLIERTGRGNERLGAQTLSAELGGLPLAHEQAAAYCAHLKVSFSAYLSRLNEAPSELLDTGRYAPSEYRNGQTVAKTFRLAIEQATKIHRAAASLIFYLAKLPVGKIPGYLFLLGRQKLQERLPSLSSDNELEIALAALRTFGLVEEYTDESQRYGYLPFTQLHRLVRLIASTQKINVADGKEEDFLAAILATAFSKCSFFDSEPPHGSGAYNILFAYRNAIVADQDFRSRLSDEAYRPLKEIEEAFHRNVHAWPH